MMMLKVEYDRRHVNLYSVFVNELYAIILDHLRRWQTLTVDHIHVHFKFTCATHTFKFNHACSDT